MKEDTETSPFALPTGDEAFDPVEAGVRRRVRGFIETILEEELQAALGRGRYERSGGRIDGARAPFCAESRCVHIPCLHNSGATHFRLQNWNRARR